MMRERATRHGLSLRLDVGPDVDVVEADELRFKQVVINLLSNAVKFTADGGTIRSSRGRRARCGRSRVTDTGIGVAPADRERIFESFQQGGSGTPRRRAPASASRSAGASSDCWVAACGWRARSASAARSAFTVPDRAREPDGRGASRHGRPAAPGPVVVIEDDRPSLDLLTAYLESAGFDVSTAHDGPSGLAAVRRVRTGRGPPRHPAAGHRRVGGAAGAQGGPGDRGIPVVVVSIVDERARGCRSGPRRTS